MTRVLTLVLLALTLSGCALPSQGRAYPRATAQQSAADPVLEVRNDHLLPIRVFTFWSGSRYFLGEVPPDRTTRFRIPRELVTAGQLQFLVDPIGSADEYTTDPVEVGDIRHIRWHVRTYLRGSRLTVM